MFLYVVKTKDSRWYKIGISYAPLARIESLQTANPQKLELCAFFDRPDAPQDELRLHQALRSFHLHGEWFCLPDGIAAALISGDWSHFGVLEQVGQVDPVACCPCVLCAETRTQRYTQPREIKEIVKPQHESNS